MLLTILNWLYIFIITFGLGMLLNAFTKKYFQYEMKKLTSILAAGIMIATVYAQFFSLFYKVGALANGILAAFSIFIYVFWRKDICQIIKKVIGNHNWCYFVTVAICFLCMAYMTSRGIIHYDTDLYHAQSIRWIEEYGVIKGLGNLHVRLAYNSSFFALSALFSLKFLIGQSLHTVNGWIAYLLLIEVLDLRHLFMKKKNSHAPGIQLSDFARFAALYYITMVLDEMVSPASDYTIICIVFYIVITWLSFIEKDERQEEIIPFALLCVGGVFAVSVKLTVGLILLLTIQPAYDLIKGRKWREIMIFILMGVVVIMPWMIRTVLISGYLLYPFPALDIFPVDWKIPALTAQMDAAEIKTWGRGLYDTSKVDLPISSWIGNWYKGLTSGTEKMLILMDALSILGLIILGIIHLFRKKLHFRVFLMMFTLSVCYLFWQTSAPLIRYGYGYVLLLCFVTAGVFITDIPIGKHFIRYCFCTILILFCFWKGTNILQYAKETVSQPYYIHQKEYGKYETDTYEVGDVLFYYPKSGDRTGYDAFPSTPKKQEFLLRNGTIKGGFSSL